MSTAEPPPPPPPPIPPPPAKRSKAPWLYALGVALILLGAGLVIPVLFARGICSFVPCDPSGGRVGFTQLDDGTVGVELGGATAEQMQDLEVVAGVRPESEDGEVLWRIERSDDVADGWVGPVVPGVAPPGFDETVTLDRPLPESYSVTVTNGCDGGPTELPRAPLAPGLVTYESGATDTVETFRADDLGFSECEEELSSGARRRAVLGLVCGFVGSLVVLLGGRVAARPPARRPT